MSSESKRHEDLSIRLVQDLVSYGHMVIREDLKIEWMNEIWLPCIGNLNYIARMRDGENLEKENLCIRLYTDNIFASDPVINS